MSQSIFPISQSMVSQLPVDARNKVLGYLSLHDISSLSLALAKAGQQMPFLEGAVKGISTGTVLAEFGRINPEFFVAEKQGRLQVVRLPKISPEKEITFQEHLEFFEKVSKSSSLARDAFSNLQSENATPEEKQQVLDLIINFKTFWVPKEDILQCMTEMDLLNAATPKQIASLLERAVAQSQSRDPSTGLLEKLASHLSKPVDDAGRTGFENLPSKELGDLLCKLSQNSDDLSGYRMVLDRIPGAALAGLSLKQIGQLLSSLSRNRNVKQEDFAKLAPLFNGDTVQGEFREIDENPLTALTLTVVKTKSPVLIAAFRNAVEVFTQDDSTRRGFYRHIGPA